MKKFLFIIITILISMSGTLYAGTFDGTFAGIDQLGRKHYIGPRGGKYYINRNGNKTYISSRKSKGRRKSFLPGNRRRKRSRKYSYGLVAVKRYRRTY